MLELQDRLKDIDQHIAELEERKRELIADEPITFRHARDTLERARSRLHWGNDRYVLIYADGSAMGYATYTQRPAAFNNARRRRGVFVLDTRTGDILAPNDEGHEVVVSSRRPL